jgi:hypothetical protein
MGEEGCSSRDHRMTNLLDSMTHRWRKQVCREGFEERRKGAAREIAVNQQDQRIGLEVCRAWLFVDLYSSSEPLS